MLVKIAGGNKPILLHLINVLISWLKNVYENSYISKPMYSKVSIKRPGLSFFKKSLLNDQVHLRKKMILLFDFRAATANFWSLLNNLGGFQLLDVIIKELKSHMTS